MMESPRLGITVERRGTGWPRACGTTPPGMMRKGVRDGLPRGVNAAAASGIGEAAGRNCVRCNFSLNPSYGSCGEVCARRWRPARARRAGHRTVACHALPARVASPGRELTGDLNAPAEVDLVRCLAFERRVGDPLVAREGVVAGARAAGAARHALTDDPTRAPTPLPGRVESTRARRQRGTMPHPG